MAKPKLGLALGSGSSRGWAHIGVIRAFQELGFEPQIISGASIGSLVGAAYVNQKLETLENWLSSLTPFKTAQFLEVNASLKGFVNRERFHAFLNQYVAQDDVLIENLEQRYAAVSTDLESGREIWLKKGRLIDAVWASIALPGLFPVIQHQGQWLVDGGLCNPVPTNICRALGAEVIVAINLNGDIVGKHFHQSKTAAKKEGLTDKLKQYTGSLFEKSEPSQTPRFFEAMAGSINIMQDKITRSRLAGDLPDLLIEPKLSHIGLMEFHRAPEAIEAGRQEVLRHRERLLELLN